MRVKFLKDSTFIYFFSVEDVLSSDGDSSDHRMGFVYSVDAEGIGFEDDLDYCDVNRYGEAYARYKKRVIKPLMRDDEELSDLDDYDSD